MRNWHATASLAPSPFRVSRRTSTYFKKTAASGALRALAATALLLAQPSRAATRVETWAREIREASKRFAIPEQWIRDVMRVESDGRLQVNGLPITSPAGAMGLMQLMPGTWAAMRRAYGLGHDPYDPHDNILAGAAYLRAMYDDYGYPGALAAYNAGPGRFAEYLAFGRPLPLETVAYVQRVVRSARSGGQFSQHSPSLRKSKKGLGSSASGQLFFIADPIHLATGAPLADSGDVLRVIDDATDERSEGFQSMCARDVHRC